MSFVKKKEYRILGKAAALRRELMAFLLLVSIWAIVMNVFASALYAVLSGWWQKAVTCPWTLPLFLLLAVAVVYTGMVLLGSGLAAGLEELRRFHLLVPVMVTSDCVEVAPVKGYWITKGLQRRLKQDPCEPLLKVFREMTQKDPGRPFQGELHAALGKAISREMLDSVIEGCRFLLSKDAEFHGFNYAELAKPPGPCAVTPVAGSPEGEKVHLPHKVEAKFGPGPADSYGKRVDEVQVKGRFGELRISVWPQWALLSPQYHGLSLEVAKTNLQTEVRDYKLNDAYARRSLWVLEIPVELRARFGNLWRPFLFLSRRFELTASWIDDLFDGIEERWSWEWFVERMEVSGRSA